MSSRAPAPRKRRGAPKGNVVCGGRGCRNPVEEGWLCPTCKARVAGVREDLERETADATYNGRRVRDGG